MFFSVLFCTVRLSIFERFVFASFEPLRFCKKVRFVFPDLKLFSAMSRFIFSESICCFLLGKDSVNRGQKQICLII